MSNKKSELIILAPSLEQPRIVKRIIEKAAEYDQISIYGFTRKIHAVKNYDVLNNYKNIDLTIIGQFSDKKYIGRSITYCKLLLALYKKYGIRSKSLYVFGIDLRIIAFLLVNSKVDYEISDIMWLYKPPFQKSVLRNIDAFLTKHSNNVSFTSKGFYDAYYKAYIPKHKVVIKENKFKTYGKVLPINNIKADKIRVAYIGAFRYTKIIEDLLSTVTNNKNLILNFYGDGFKSIVETIKEFKNQHENIYFHGAFKNPDDLERIYAENNLNFVVYDNSLENERIAMPNKYYESGFFNIPIVCAENTYVGKRVLEQKMGWVCGITQDEIKTFLNSLEIQDLVDCHDRIKCLDKSMFES